MSQNIKDPDASIAFQILAYLAENPEAEDSLEGITEWWILQQQLKLEARRVKVALTKLVEKDFIQEVSGLDNRTYYRINRKKYTEIMKIIRAAEI